MSSGWPPASVGPKVRPIFGRLAGIEPLHVAAYIEAMQSGFEKPSVKQHLAAFVGIRRLVTGQAVATKIRRYKYGTVTRVVDLAASGSRMSAR